MNFELGQSLPPHDVVAKNYGADHDNKIHSDEGAARFGFARALVPGVALYAYLTRPVVEALGRRWIERGAMSAKFLNPIYDGEQVQARAVVTAVDPAKFDLQLFNSSETLCVAGTASLPRSVPSLDADDYPLCPLPADDQRLPATIASFAVGKALGSTEFEIDLKDEKFLDEMAEASPLYKEVCHPALWPAMANELLMRNIALGPWIHTASETQHFNLPRGCEKISMRGRVTQLHEKRGHEILVTDLGAFGEDHRPLARIKHSAIIKIGL